MSTLDEDVKGLMEFASLEAGSLERIRNLCYGVKCSTSVLPDEKQSSYLELIQARRHYFSNSVATISKSDELTEIIKDFEQSYQISKGISPVFGRNEVHCDTTYNSWHDDDALEEMILPPGEIASSNIDIEYTNSLKVDNFIDDESFGVCNFDTSPQKDDNNAAYVPSFTTPPSREAQLNDQSFDDSNCSQSDGRYTLDEMCELLKEDSDSDEEVSFLNGVESAPIQINIPIQKMDLKVVAGQQKIRSDADLFLEHYIQSMKMCGPVQELSNANTKKEIVIDMEYDDDVSCQKDHLDHSTHNEVDFSNDASFDEDGTVPQRVTEIMTEYFRNKENGATDDVVHVTSEDLHHRFYDDVQIF